MYPHFTRLLKMKSNTGAGVKNILRSRTCLTILVEFWQKDCPEITGIAT